MDSRRAANYTPTLPVPHNRRQVRLGLGVALFGFIVFLLGAKPALFGLDRSPVVGFVQISVFLIGLGFICLGGYLSLLALWKNQRISIATDIGVRLVATGYVVAVFTGLADVFGIGSQPLPLRPYFGEWQAMGVILAEGIIAIGLVLMIPFGGSKPPQSKPGALEKEDSGSKPAATSIS